MTTDTLTLTDFLLARIAEDEWWAQEAGRHGDAPLVEGGEHWRWECTEDDQELTVDPARSEFLECPRDQWVSVGLRSVERYPFRALAGDGPSIHLASDEVRPSLAGHIARHDPARVLAECEAKRRIVALHKPVLYDGGSEALNGVPRDPETYGWVLCSSCGDQGWNDFRGVAHPCDTLKALAAPYANDSDYRAEWAPDA